jgi:Mg-chelatase subunit ChlD
LITFGTTAGEKLSRTISSDKDMADLRAALRNLKADHHFTDIGVAMETLAAVQERRNTQDSSRQVILFITDGKNAPPRESS